MTLQTKFFTHSKFGTLWRNPEDNKRVFFRLLCPNQNLVQLLHRFYSILNPESRTIPYELQISDFRVRSGRRGYLVEIDLSIPANLESFAEFSRKIYGVDTLADKMGQLGYLIRLAHFGIALCSLASESGSESLLAEESIFVRLNKMIRYRRSGNGKEIIGETPVYVDVSFFRLPDLKSLFECGVSVVGGIDNIRSFETVFDSKKFSYAFEGNYL